MRRFLLLTVTGMVTICPVNVGSSSAGNGSATTEFFTSYFDHGVESDCTGTRVVQKDGTVKDSATCILSGDTSRLVSGTVKGNPGYCLNAVCWQGLDAPDTEVERRARDERHPLRDPRPHRGRLLAMWSTGAT